MDQTLFFMGDSGYTSSFREIAQRFGPVDLATLAIGAYAPRWMMENQHIDPIGAVQLFQDLQCRRLCDSLGLPLRWPMEPLDEPPELLAQALNNAGISHEQFIVEPIGSGIAY